MPSIGVELYDGRMKNRPLHVAGALTLPAAKANVC